MKNWLLPSLIAIALMAFCFKVMASAETAIDTFQKLKDCTRMNDEGKMLCMKDNKKNICDKVKDELIQDQCMKNLLGDRTKM
jgi:hypothetical protein